MEIAPFSGDLLTSRDTDVVVVGVAEDLKLGSYAAKFNAAAGQALDRLLECGEVSGKVGDTTIILAPAGLSATHLVVVGLGTEPDVGDAFRIAASAVKSVTAKARQRILMALDVAWDKARQEAAVAGAVVAATGQDLYRQEKNRIAPKAILWANASSEICDRGKVLGESVNLTRRLVNTPASDMYPESFAQEASQVALEAGLEIEIWDEHELKKQRCEALLAVARGSAKAPRLVIARHQGVPDDRTHLALVGKGVTFDSGGLSIKPSDGMKTMKCDMAGAATVLGALQAIARLKLPVNVTGVMGLVENMIGPDSYKLGDVLHARNGKTIEVLNTDAEGRLVLADALDVAAEDEPERMIDLATLTGACVVALGNDVAGVMANNAAWCQQLLDASTHCGEHAWELPMYPEFSDQIRSEIADIKNIGDGRWGGAITAAKFLEEFVPEVPWVHVDIAGPSFADKPKPWIDAGATGTMVRTLVEVARRISSDSRRT